MSELQLALIAGGVAVVASVWGYNRWQERRQQQQAEQLFGDRSGGAQDMCGNFWWVATHIEDVPEEEMKRRHEAALGGH